ncbi:MBL fold metallo-hydrolase [Methanohalophilus sp.]|uniref:MBL fold metallo-hydrolase n=1 Tax=Methanohalophilus sp. TaxID=1966352 RepID=UPI0026183957|nr:MBL fold metallo-hydrolase [Methanohalophilus sp.]MDK2891910.1 phosphoribosyl 1,2-cyclic phosphate phosphodiesterase [Methanohalophilus sp.]
MKITLLGTGDAPGTPIIGCHCPTCNDAQRGTKSQRLRSSLLVENEYGKVLIDTGPDLRAQLLKNGVEHVDGVIWTHGHYDHFTGFAEFHRVQYKVDVYGITETLDYIVDYLSFLGPKRHDIPMYKPFELIGLKFTLFEVKHRPYKRAVGVMIQEGVKKVVFTGDSESEFLEKSLEVMDSPDLLIADAIVPDRSIFHIKKHMDAIEAMELGKRIHAKNIVLTHLSHYFKPHVEASKEYPLGYDGMQLEI